MVVPAGLTLLLVCPVTLPTPWSMLKLVAPELVQARVLEWPDTMEAGVAVKLVMNALSDLGLDSRQNTNYPQALKRVLAQQAA